MIPLIECELLSIASFDLNGLGRAVQDESIHGLDLSGGNGHAGLQTIQHNFARIVGVVRAIIRSDRLAAAVYHLKRNAWQGFVGGAVDELPDGKRGGGIIFEVQIVPAIAAGGSGCAAGISGTASRTAADDAVTSAVLHNDGFGRGIQHISIRDLGFNNYNCAARNKAGDRYRPILTGGVLAQDIAIPVLDGELRAGNRFSGDGIPLRQREAAQGFIVKYQSLGVCGIYLDCLDLCGGVNDIAGAPAVSGKNFGCNFLKKVLY